MAQEAARKLYRSYEFAFRRRYNLPPTDPRFKEATEEEIETDYWAHLFFENPKEAEAEVAHDSEFNQDEILKAMESDDWEEV